MNNLLAPPAALAGTMTTADYKAGKTRINADYKADKSACAPGRSWNTLRVPASHCCLMAPK